MQRINPEGQLTRRERLATVITLLVAVVVHLVALFGAGQIAEWGKEEKKKERLMVIRRVRDIVPRKDASVPQQAGGRAVPAAPKGAVADRSSSPPPPAPKVKEPGPEPPKEELSPRMEEELEKEEPGKEQKANEQGDNVVSVVTDLSAASFSVAGPAEYRGAGTFWLRKGAPPGKYTVTFHPVAGYATPPLQTKELAAKGQIVFMGKYKRSVEIVVESNVAEAEFDVYRPDGRSLDMHRVGRAVFDDLPPGNYTVAFKDVPGRITPAPVVKSLPHGGGDLSFFGEYREGGGARIADARGQAVAVGAGARKRGADEERQPAPAKKPPARAGERGLDRRVQMVVTSYPPTDIEEDFDPIPYPELIIQRSNFQQGWCQVYLVLGINAEGAVENVTVERPGAEGRAQFGPLIQAVETAARRWDYDKVRAEVHIDVRFYVE